MRQENTIHAPDWFLTNPSITRHDCGRAETRKGGEARREQSDCSGELFLGKTSEQGHHFGSARSVNVCKPAYELSSNSENVHPSAPPVLRYAHPQRERESRARVSRMLAHTETSYRRLTLRPRKTPSPLTSPHPYLPGHPAPRVDDAGLPGSVLDGGSE